MIKPNTVNPRKSLNKAFLKLKPNRTEIESFKSNLRRLFDGINESESEEFHKNLVADFLKGTYYGADHFINTKGRNDLVIHVGKDAKTNVGVIIEAKSPANKTEMLKKNNINQKAFHELILYYLRERITAKNIEVKHLIATNIYEWFIFDSRDFDKLFAQNKALVKQFTDFEEKRLASTDTAFFYKEIAEKFVASLDAEISFTYFDIRDYEKPLRNFDKKDDNVLIALYKLLSPQHLLKQAFLNDSNSLDKTFYSELLHIIGLEETKEGSKKLIGRKATNRNNGSLLENAIIQLDTLDKISRIANPLQFGNNTNERLYNVSLELVITWINRILFLKLLEAQLVTYHKGDKNFEFLNIEKIKDFDELNSLFFRVLARKPDERSEDVAKAFATVPYLNSSLFEPTELEQLTIFINCLRTESKIPILSNTVLKDATGKKRNGELNPLEYIFEFLNAYDFSSEGSEEIQEENKTLINASVLGLIFEKINGYKDGSFFTPGFITMYMCRETIRRAILQKFNQPIPLPGGGQGVGSSSPSPGSQGVGSSSPSGGGQGVSSSSPSGGGQGVGSSSPSGGGQGVGSLSPSGGGQGVGSLSPSGGGQGVGQVSSSWKSKITPYRSDLPEKARKLRNNPTVSEQILWKVLKGKNQFSYDFHRQKPLDSFIADFYCRDLKLVIELDGATHLSEDVINRDKTKEQSLNELGINVLRFPDALVINDTSQVLKQIEIYIDAFLKKDSTRYRDVCTPDLSYATALNPLSGRGCVFRGSGNLEGLEDTPPNPLSRGGGNTPPCPLSRGGEEEERYKSLDDVYNAIGRDFTKEEANSIINSLKICDPAVGSGHFLVSALNEIIAIKSELKILADTNGKTLRDYSVEVVNDELIVTDEDGRPYAYNPANTESRRVQETLFREKQTIIENCLFGVDINPNSVKICRLRLWIELLKNAYYKFPLLAGGQGVGSSSPSGGGQGVGSSSPSGGGQGVGSSSPSGGGQGVGSSSPSGGGQGVGSPELETLPNIDINIKCGNSLISRYALDSDIKSALKKSKWSVDSYRLAVMTYRNAQSKDEKREMEKLIGQIKNDFESEVAINDKRVIRLRKLKADLLNLTTQTSLFEKSKAEKTAWNKQVNLLTADVQKLEAEIEQIKSNKIYENAFEWRFEFPEVLNDEGDFVGFDCVIGNPPYIRQEELRDFKSFFKNNFKLYSGTADIYIFFIEKGVEILKNSGAFTYIMPNKFMQAAYGQAARKFLLNHEIKEIIDFGDFQVFEEATTYPCILRIIKKISDGTFDFSKIKTDDFSKDFYNYVINNRNVIKQNSLNAETWVIGEASNQMLMHKLTNNEKKLEKYLKEGAKRGVLTGLTEAFLINDETKKRIIQTDKNSVNFIKPFLLGRDVKPYSAAKNKNWLILIPKGYTIKSILHLNDPNNLSEPVPRYGYIEYDKAWQWFKVNHPGIANHLEKYKDKAEIRTDKGDYWWELRACDYYHMFERPKILYQVFQVKPCFIFDDKGMFCNNSMWFIPSDDKVLLGILNSKMGWWLISKYCTAIQNGFQLIWKYFGQIPIAAGNKVTRKVIEGLVNVVLDKKNQSSSADTTALETEIDRLVYELYGLTEEEIKIVEGA